MPVTRVRTAGEARDRLFGAVLLLAVIAALTLWLMAWIDGGFARGASTGHFMAAIVASAVVILTLISVGIGFVRRIRFASSRKAEPNAPSDEDAR